MYDRCNGNSPAGDQFRRILHDDASEMQFVWSFNWKIVTFRSFITYVRVHYEYQMERVCASKISEKILKYAATFPCKLRCAKENQINSFQLDNWKQCV